MDNNKSKNTDRMNGAFNTLSDAEAAYGLSKWFGAIIFYFLNLGRVPFDILHSKKYDVRNVLVGYSLNLLLAAAILYVLYYLENLGG